MPTQSVDQQSAQVLVQESHKVEMLKELVSQMLPHKEEVLKALELAMLNQLEEMHNQPVWVTLLQLVAMLQAQESLILTQ